MAKKIYCAPYAGITALDKVCMILSSGGETETMIKDSYDWLD